MKMFLHLKLDGAWPKVNVMELPWEQSGTSEQAWRNTSEFHGVVADRGQLEVRSFRRVAREGCSVMLSTRVALDVSLFKQISKAAGLPGRGHKACTPGSNSAEQARKLLRVAQGHGDVRSRAA